MNAEFWKDKRVFLTGHTGFKGSWLSLWLHHSGATVSGYALPPPTDPSLYQSARISEVLQNVTGDIRNFPSLQHSLNQFEPDIVIHMAAQPLVRYSYANPVETFETNVMGTVNLLEAVRVQEKRPKAVLVITSDKCYENREWLWGYRENEPMGGHDPYSSSKGCAELVTSAYLRSFFPSADYSQHGVALATARAGNVIGGGDWAEDRLIPDIIRSFFNKQNVIIRNPNAIRPWQHVLEPLHGYLMLIENLWQSGPEYMGAWNFGPEDRDAKPVSWILERLIGHWGDGAGWELDKVEGVHEASYLKLDCSKAQTKLNYLPTLCLPDTLEWVVDWYQAYLAQNDMRAFTLNQISLFEQRIKNAIQ